MLTQFKERKFDSPEFLDSMWTGTLHSQETKVAFLIS